MILLCSLQCPVLIAWGDKDPWEPIELGRNYGNFDSVEDFVILPNVGHCPQVLLSLCCSLSHMHIHTLTNSHPPTCPHKQHMRQCLDLVVFVCGTIESILHLLWRAMHIVLFIFCVKNVSSCTACTMVIMYSSWTI